MKTVFLAFLLCLLSCGKNNESGKPTVKFPQPNPVVAVNEDLVRDDFIGRGLELLNTPTIKSEIVKLFGLRTYKLIENRLVRTNVFTSRSLLMDEKNKYTRSNNRGDQVTIYVGDEEPTLSWVQFRGKRDIIYDQWVMHELLLLGNVADPDLIYTNRILKIRTRTL